MPESYEGENIVRMAFFVDILSTILHFQQVFTADISVPQNTGLLIADGFSATQKWALCFFPLLHCQENYGT